MRRKDILKKQFNDEFIKKGWAFRSDRFKIKDALVKELISKAYSVCFKVLIFEPEEETVLLEHTGKKTISYKFRRSVKNIASRKSKKGQSDEIQKDLFDLKQCYMHNQTIDDIEHYDSFVEISCISDTNPNLRVCFRVYSENIDENLFFDISIRHYRSFFEDDG
jgi:hypothetical protein